MALPFALQGFEALNYVEHTDYELIQSSNPDFNGALVRVNIFQGDHRQTIQYIQPTDAIRLSQVLRAISVNVRPTQIYLAPQYSSPPLPSTPPPLFHCSTLSQDLRILARNFVLTIAIYYYPLLVLRPHLL